MANSSELNILLSAQLNKTVGADLQKELDKLSQSLKLNLNATVKGLEGVSSSTGGTTQATQKATQALTVYEKAINNIIHSYKLKQTTDDQFVQSMNKAIQMQNFQTLSWQKQEQIIGLVSKAEQSYTKVRNEGIKNNSAIEKQNEDIKRKELEALHSEALEINKVFDLKRKQSEQTLQYEQKVRKAIEETNLKEQQTTKQLEEQIILFQKRMALESQRITGKYGSLVDSSSLNSLMNDINSLSPATENVTNKMKDFSLGMKEVELGAKNNSKAFKGAQQDSISWGAELARSAKKFSEWYLLAGGITSVFALIKSGLSYVTELDNSLNEIRIVTGKTEEQVNSLAKSYNNLAKEMNTTTKEVASEAANLFRQGLDSSQVEERMKAIIQYSKISSISIADSDKIITATANATGESVQKIIDIFALLGDQTASGADEIGEALQKVASAADNSGLSLEKSASWIATISSITRESASTIGRSINSIISRYEQIKSTGFNSEDETKLNDVVKALSDIGIKATDSMGQLLPFADVMDAVGAKFNTLSKNEQAYITTAMFGTFQRNKGLTLLKNYNDSLKNYETALNASGTAEQKFSIYQESSQASIDKFKATLEGLAQDTIDSGLVKSLINLGTGLVSIIDKVGLLNIAIIATVGYFTLFKTQMVFTPIINAATSAITKLTAGLNLSATAALRLNTVLGTLAPLAIVGGVMALIGVFRELYVSVEEQQQKVTELSNSYNSLKSKIDELKAVQNPTKEQSDYLQLLERELELKNEILQTEKASLIDKDVFGKGIWGNGISGKVKENIQYYSELQEAIKNTEEEIKNMQAQGLDTSLELGQLDDLKSQLKDIELSFIENKKALTDYANSASGENKEKINALISSINTLLPSLQAQNKATQETAKTNTTTSITTDQLTKKIEEQNKEVDSLQSSAKDLASVYDQLNEGEKVSASTILDLISKYPEYASQLVNINNSKEAGIELTKSLFEIEKQKTIAKLENDKKELYSELMKISSIQKAYQNFLAITSPDGTLTVKEENRLNGILDTEIIKDPIASDVQKQVDGLNASIEVIKNASLPDFSSNLNKKEKDNPTDKNPEKYKLELDRYAGLNQALNEVNNALEENKTLEEEANNESIPLLNKEIELLGKKRQAINDIVWEQKQEANDLRYNLESGYSIGFNENGTPDAGSYDSVITGMVDRLNNMKSGDAYDALKTEIDNLKSSYERYIELFQKDIPSNTRDMLKIGTDIAKVENDKISLSFKIAEKDAQGLNDALDGVEATLKGLSDDDLVGRMSAYKAEQKANNDLLWYWNEEMKKFAEGSEEWKKAKEYVQKYTEGMNSATKAINELIDKQKEAASKQVDTLDSAIKDYSNSLEKIMKQEEKNHETRLQQIEDEKDAFDDYIEDKLDAIEREKEANDYNSDINELNADLTKLQNERATYLMASQSGDGEAIAKITELDKSIADKKKSIAEKESDREYTLRKENLSDLKENYDKQSDATKDLESKRYNAVKDTYDSLKSDIDEFTSAGINADTSLVNSIFADWDNLSKQLSSPTKAMASTFENNFLSKIREAKTLIGSLQTQLGITPTTSTASLSGSFTVSSEDDTVAQMKANSSLWNTSATDEQRKRLEDKNLQLGSSLGWTRDEASGIWYKKDGTRAYANGTTSAIGGLSRINDGGGTELRVLNSGDGILTSSITSNLNLLGQNIPTLLNSLLNITTSIPKIASVGVSPSISMGNININVTGNATEAGVNKLTSNIMAEMKSTFTRSGVVVR